MSENPPPPRPTSPHTATGGCALGCGFLFVLAGLAYPLVLILTRRYEFDKIMLPLGVGGGSFLLGHILAIRALLSPSDAAKTSGKRALAVMWGGVAVAGVVMLATGGVKKWVSCDYQRHGKSTTYSEAPFSPVATNEETIRRGDYPELTQRQA